MPGPSTDLPAIAVAGKAGSCRGRGLAGDLPYPPLGHGRLFVGAGLAGDPPCPARPPTGRRSHRPAPSRTGSALRRFSGPSAGAEVSTLPVVAAPGAR